MRRSFLMISAALLVPIAASGHAVAKPGQTGKSGVTFGGGVPGGGTPGPAQPTRPTQPTK